MSARRKPLILGLWLACVLALLAVVSQARFVADLSFLLPRTPTAEQQVLVDQLKDGVVSRLLLVGISAEQGSTRAALSKAVAARLRADSAFLGVSNGESVALARDRELLFQQRYLLSGRVNPEHFSTPGLRSALEDSLDWLGSPAGLLLKDLLPRDPTGETLALLQSLSSGSQPASAGGVWVSRDGQRALLLLQTRANGTDTDAQELALKRLLAVFEEARQALGAPAASARLLVTGPGYFAVQSRHTIKSEVSWLSSLGMLAIAVLLLTIYRSVPALLLGLVPVLCGALAGVAAVSLGFGVVHGITLGFGTALIGEAVDYAIYLFVQSEQEVGDARWVQAFWPTIRLGVLTSIIGFASQLFSGFPGLAQLGLYAIAGLVSAALVTRFVLPLLLPAGFRIRDVSPMGHALARGVETLRHWRWGLLGLCLVAGLYLLPRQAQLWHSELGGLSPISAQDEALDLSLRSDLGAPDSRYLVVATGPSAEAALEQAERVGARLDGLVEAGELAGYETAARFLPSQATQAQRRASLPTPEELRPRLIEATRELPLSSKRLEPFLADIAQARTSPLLTRADLEGSTLALAVDSMLMPQSGHWSALLPLRAPDAGPHAHEVDAARVRAALATLGPQVLFVDMKAESNALYAWYLREAKLLSLGGLLAIILLLALVLRQPGRVLRVLLPLGVTLILVLALLALAQVRLTILHLVGLLLVVAVGSNYALFFNQSGPVPPRTLASLLFANLTTVAGFGILAFSSVPVLQAIGATVGPGAILALLSAAILSPAPDPDTADTTHAAGPA